MDKTTIYLDVNGVRHEVHCEPRKLLSDVLREDCRLTGTHVGCEHGVCGACTVLINDRPARACLAYAVQMDEARIRTIEDVVLRCSRHCMTVMVCSVASARRAS
jgi:aerobic carbon-monoxide dehydrogenase small subunit